MRIILFILLFVPIICLAQKSSVFIKLTDSRSQPIKGEATLKGYERWLEATSFSSAGKNNTQISFTMNVCAASADLKRAMTTGEVLLTGQVTVLATSQTLGAPVISYTIKMENISVTACSDVMGCNNVMNTTVTLQATRIGWTYYDQSRTGGQTVSRKFGWDAEAGREWTGF